MLGIYKPGKPIYSSGLYFDDMVNYSGPIVTIMDFAKQYQEVRVLSVLDDKHRFNEESHNKFDVIILFCGVHAKDPLGEDVFRQLKNITKKLIYINDDLNLYPSNLKVLSYVDEVYSYSLPVYGLDNKFHHISPLLSAYPDYLRYRKKIVPRFKDRVITMYYSGSEGDARRFAGIKEFVLRPNVIYKLKSKTLGFDTRISKYEFDAYVEKTKYTILLADGPMYDTNFVTARFYEYAMRGAAPIAYKEFDRNNIDTPLSVPRVSEYIELYNIIENTPESQWEHWIDEWNRYIDLKFQELTQQIIDMVKP
ncbi:MAG: hypothetical protein QXL94_08455 [Candidatus Parvarchaeum sp.]